VARLGARRNARARVRLAPVVREFASELRPDGLRSRRKSCCARLGRGRTKGARGAVRRVIATLLANDVARTPNGGIAALSTVKTARMVQAIVSPTTAPTATNTSAKASSTDFPTRRRAARARLGLYIVIVRRLPLTSHAVRLDVYPLVPGGGVSVTAPCRYRGGNVCPTLRSRSATAPPDV
jgi:hypothetical protein